MPFQRSVMLCLQANTRLRLLLNAGDTGGALSMLRAWKQQGFALDRRAAPFLLSTFVANASIDDVMEVLQLLRGIGFPLEVMDYTQVRRGLTRPRGSVGMSGTVVI
jgi:hypothetical protein